MNIFPFIHSKYMYASFHLQSRSLPKHCRRIDRVTWHFFTYNPWGILQDLIPTRSPLKFCSKIWEEKSLEKLLFEMAGLRIHQPAWPCLGSLGVVVTHKKRSFSSLKKLNMLKFWEQYILQFVTAWFLQGSLKIVVRIFSYNLWRTSSGQEKYMQLCSLVAFPVSGWNRW